MALSNNSRRMLSSRLYIAVLHTVLLLSTSSKVDGFEIASLTSTRGQWSSWRHNNKSGRSLAPTPQSLNNRVHGKIVLNMENRQQAEMDMRQYEQYKTIGFVNDILSSIAKIFVKNGYETDIRELRKFLQIVSIIRVTVPSVLAAYAASQVYTPLSLEVATWIDAQAIEVVANDYAQYIQNVLTTSGLMFSITVCYTYYFLYQQQEAVYHALFEEVTQAKSLLEQIALVSQGRSELYQNLLDCIERYIYEDLYQLNVEPSVLLSKMPMDDPLEEIMYLTSVGEPSRVYQTVRELRQARAFRLGALQKKLPSIHFVLVWSLAAVLLTTFPLLGAGSQTIGGLPILGVQSLYMGIIVFGISMIMGVLYELRNPGGTGAYSVVAVMKIMVGGLVEEIDARQAGQYEYNKYSPEGGLPGSPSDDSFLMDDGSPMY